MLHQLRLCGSTPFAAILAGSLLVPSLAYADVTYQETTQITGGSMVGMLKLVGAFSSQAKSMTGPMTTTVMIHGGRMVRAGQHLTQIIDLDKHTVTSVDNDKHTYTVMTFEQLQQQMAKAMGQAKGTMAPQGASADMTFDAHVSTSGAAREIDGKHASESLLTVTMTSKQADAGKGGMAATTEMWSVDDVPGLQELRAFNVRLAKELAVQMQASALSSLMASQPGGQQAVAELRNESAKMNGFPVLQLTRIGLSSDGRPLPAPSEAPLKPGSNQGSSTAAAITKEAATGTATATANDQMSRLGTFGRALSGSTMGALIHHKPKTTSTDATSATSTPDATAGVLLETRTQTSGFSIAPVESAALEVPAGYKAIALATQSK